MEVKTYTPEGYEFMSDILTGDESKIANYINSVGIEKACENIYKMAEYANDATIQIEEFDDNSETVAELEKEIESLNSKYSMFGFYQEQYREIKKENESLKAIIAAMSAIVTKQ